MPFIFCAFLPETLPRRTFSSSGWSSTPFRLRHYVCHFALNEFNQIMDGLANENPKYLRHANKDLKKEQDMLKKFCSTRS